MDAVRIEDLLALMATLRDPEVGCSWDVAQDFSSIAPYTVEEAYEVADAIARGDTDDLRDELGDLLLQVVFHARIAEEAGLFAFPDVVRAVVEKMVRRHPHVFAPDGTLLPKGSPRRDPEAVARQWEAIKARERREKPPLAGGPLAGVPLPLPALTRAQKLSAKAATYGFDWPDPEQVVLKVREEIDEVADAMANGTRAAIAEELGDLLFSVANLARHLGIDPEYSLREGNMKFERRFDAMAARLSEQGRGLSDSDLDAMEAAWRAVKRAEKG
ncbi:nucleoside triphosphate pyrophosphohydrolase [Methylobacterium sp. J-068]|uniref:nucleoside triphosphate pyrophosphohydrolase n=1 Tax=Methylobacterium sp. J-068 TaxID=2836649 RepID=UPI001FBBC3C7|nr:nucleoside triphosphate pyrophosphohydrolase [Methylobacterium sp. J-068]MCJ2035734.1 nucleoside triphosphate pyrophosphohydrolase [Methylobacterium sp. J-068]